MNPATDLITPHHTLAELAATRAGASRVFYRHGLDFCCHGRVSLAEACAKKRLDVEALVREIEAEVKAPGVGELWNERPIPELFEHVVEDYHAAHPAEMPRQRAIAKRVE
jgi:regulator of cell morphogenesis and NO signaling